MRVCARHVTTGPTSALLSDGTFLVSSCEILEIELDFDLIHARNRH